MIRFKYLVIPASFVAASGLLVNACGGGSFNSGSEGGSGGANAGSSSSSGGTSSNAGSTASGGSSSGGTSSGGTSSGGSAVNGGTSSGGSSPSGGSAGSGGKADCATLRADLDAALALAQACDPSLGADQCSGSVHGVCGCMIPTRPNDSDVTKAYLAALMAVQDNDCVGLCPAIACIVPGPGTCVANAMGKLGTCQSSSALPQ